MRINIDLDAWCAFSPGGQHHSATELLEQDLATDVSFLAPIKRRRLSTLSRLSLRLAYSIAPEFHGNCVFGSQHGELVTTQGLLQSIVENEIVSPAGFSASVHNTAVGLHSINNQNRSACTSIAAGLDSLAMCFVEAYALLQQEPVEQVLVVFADDRLPDALVEFASYNQLHGFAALVRRGEQGKKSGLLRIDLEQVKKNPETTDKDSISALIDCLLEGRSSGYTTGENNDWNWQFSV